MTSCMYIHTPSYTYMRSVASLLEPVAMILLLLRAPAAAAALALKAAALTAAQLPSAQIVVEQKSG